jgi:Flp pilus assembly protein TadB
MFERELRRLKVRARYERLLGAALLAGLGLAALEAWRLDLPPASLLPLAVASATLPALLLHFGLEYLRARRLRKLEETLPAALLYAASLPPRAGIEKVLRDLARPENGPLGEEFGLAWRQVEGGASVPEALEALRARNPSPPLDRAVALLLSSHRSGADLSRAMSEAAEDALALRALSLEAKAALALHKYTLLGAGALLVPFLLGVLLTLSASLQADGALWEGIGLAPEERSALLEAVLAGAQAYLALFAILAGGFVALQEGEPKKAVLYFAALAPLSLLTFHAARSLRVL